MQTKQVGWVVRDDAVPFGHAYPWIDPACGYLRVSMSTETGRWLADLDPTSDDMDESNRDWVRAWASRPGMAGEPHLIPLAVATGL